ncbi:MAG: carboxypeptidase regulatory-like domain-containing protein [bacterium]
MKHCLRHTFLLWVVLLLPLALAACSDDDNGGEKTGAVQPEELGVINGLVQDRGTAVPGASVTLTPGNQQATTDAEGRFSFGDLEVGVYSLTVSSAGHNTVKRSNVIVVTGSSTDLVFALLAVGTAPAKVIGEDETIQLTPADFGLDAGSALSEWKTSNALVAAVNEDGTVLGVRKGKAEISAIRADNNALVSVLVAVLEPSTVFGYVNSGDPVTTAQSGYIGSERCSACHPGQFDEWKKTGHNMMVRSVSQPGLAGQGVVADANGNGVDDFIEGLDLGSSPNAAAFAAYGANAPKLGYSDDGKYTITVGAVTYEVALTVGGNGYWKQRYLIRLSDSHYFSPVQYNEATDNYVVYGAGDWYDAGNLPRYSDPATVAQSFDKTRSWERRCAGCHTTGTRVAFDGGEWEAGYVQLSVGCESCHGPAGEHPQAALSGDPDKRIVNPANLSRQAANDLCGSCHTRGTSVDTLGDHPFDFPAVVQDNAARGFRPGLDVLSDFMSLPYFDNKDFYLATEVAGEYWGQNLVWRGAHGGTPANYQTFVASKGHHQQFLDYVQGPHGQSDGVSSCAACHDSHSTAQAWNIRSEITESDCVGDFCESECPTPQTDVAVQTRNDDNSLCLACHANWGPFKSLCKDDVNNAPDKVQVAVRDHMGVEALMGNVPYDPENTGLGRCSECHLPKMGQSAVTQADADGKSMGDVHAHTFEVVWPSASAFVDPTMPNSCSVCHSSSDPTPGLKAVAQWSHSGHADVTARHWTYAAGPDRQACVRCHSGNGYVDFLAGVPEADRNTTPKMHSCYTCHDPESGLPYQRRQVASVSFPSGFTTTAGGDALICLNCHQGRTWRGTVDDALALTGADFSASSLNTHYKVAGALLYGTDAQEGFEYPDKTYRGQHYHIELNCVACHMSETGGQEELGGHSWKMAEDAAQNQAVCLNCHATIGEFKQFQIFQRDYDGDGAVEGVGEEVEGLKETLLTEIEARGIAPVEGHPYWDPTTGGPWDGPDGPALKKAAYNYLFVEHDPGAYVHNGKFAAQLLRDSYEDLTGTPLPGVRP